MTTIIYSHGNSSDLSDCLPFLLELMNVRNVDIVVYDYTGYGASRKTEVSEESICKDL